MGVVGELEVLRGQRDEAASQLGVAHEVAHRLGRELDRELDRLEQVIARLTAGESVWLAFDCESSTQGWGEQKAGSGGQ